MDGDFNQLKTVVYIFNIFDKVYIIISEKVTLSYTRSNKELQKMIEDWTFALI